MITVAQPAARPWDGQRVLRFLTGLAMLALAVTLRLPGPVTVIPVTPAVTAPATTSPASSAIASPAAASALSSPAAGSPEAAASLAAASPAAASALSSPAAGSPEAAGSPAVVETLPDVAPAASGATEATTAADAPESTSTSPARIVAVITRPAVVVPATVHLPGGETPPGTGSRAPPAA